MGFFLAFSSIFHIFQDWIASCLAMTKQKYNVSTMLKYIEKLRAKPTDRTIRIVRTVFALILILIITFGIQKTQWNYDIIPLYLIYTLYLFPFVGLVRGIFDPGIFRRKVWKWTVFSLGIAMMIVALFLIETNTIFPTQSPGVVTSSSGISADRLSNQPRLPDTAPFVIDTDFWIGFLGFWVAIFGFALTSKNITKKNERYGEKVTKIRV